jgi:hypothetical protein
MQKVRSWVFAGTVLALAQAAIAASVPFAGTLSPNDPVFNRPLQGTPPTGLSGIGTAVTYDLFPFFVSAADTYTLQTLSAVLSPGTADDTFMVLYQTAFNAASPLTNVLQAADDTVMGNLSLITTALLPGVQYFMVVTTFSNAAFGDYTGSITNSGAGTAVLGVVPEPSSAMMMLAALAVGGLVMTRRRQT